MKIPIPKIFIKNRILNKIQVSNDIIPIKIAATKSIDNNGNVLNHIVKNCSWKPTCNVSITSDNRNKLTKLFGKAHDKYNNSEFTFDVWFLVYNKLEFVLFSAENKGTCIEIRDVGLHEIIYNKELENNIIDFLTVLYNMLIKIK